MKALSRRVAALETRRRFRSPQRIVVHYEGQPEPEGIDENTLLIRVVYEDAPLPYAPVENAL